jgi:hypothetical protein
VTTDDAGHLFLAVDASGGVWSSADGAQSFTREATADGPLYAVSMNQFGTDALAVGAHGVAMERDGAGNWAQVSLGTAVDLYAALIPDTGDDDYAAGAGGMLLTRRGRGAWTSVPSGTTSAIYGLEDL